MARINIEDKFWLEIVQLAIALGDQDRAVGMAVRFFRVAQESHKAGKLISEEEFKRSFHESMIGVFAERVEGGVRAMGAEKHFGWLAKRVEAGRKGGSKPKQTKANESKTRKRKQTEPSPSPSPSSSSSDSSSSILPSEVTAAETGGAHPFIKAYCERFKARWGVNPPIQGKDQGIAGRLAKGRSPERIGHLLDAYFAMPDAWVVKGKHTLSMLEMKLNEVVVFADSGKFTTNREVRQADDMATNYQLLQKINEGKL